MQESYEHIPHPALREWVASAYGYRISGVTPGVHIGMPSPVLTLIVPLDEPLLVGSSAAEPVAHDSVLGGLQTAPAFVLHDGNQFGMQVGLHPTAARAVFGLPAGALVDQTVTLESALGARGRIVVERLREARTWADRFAILDAALLAELAREHAVVDRPIGRAWRLSLRAATPVSAIAQSAGWSQRNLQKQFRREFGISPGEAGRLARFTRSHRLVADQSLSLAEAAARAGYADQPHMTRSWSRYAGLTPARWRAEDALAFRGSADS